MAGHRPAMVTLASPDPQAFRPPDQPKNVLQVGLPTNFKAARFDGEEATQMLRNLEADIDAARYNVGGAFEKYAKAAEGLGKPSSAARALFGGAEHIERVDCLVRRIAKQQGQQSETLDEIVSLVDDRLARNCAPR